MKLPPKNEWFKAKAYWYSYDTDGDSTEHGPAEILAIRLGKDEYNFIHKGQAYLHESLGEIIEWELITLKPSPSTPALSALVEKVEKLTIEQCASAYAAETRTWRAWPQAEAAMRQGSKAIRALPTGNIKLEDLL